MPAKKVLVVDDDPILREAVAYNLKREGYDCLLASDGPTALGLASSHKPDLVLLDLMMPGMDGLEVCRVLRRGSDVPILILTAKDEEFDKVLGLEVGADDYVTKPFSIRELLARVKVHLRRADQRRAAGTATEALPEQIIRGDVRIIPAKREVRLADRPIRLTAKEYDLLQLLARHPGVVFTRDVLLERVWHFEFPGATTRTVDVHVNSLRKKLEPDPSNPRYIQTVRSVGYRFAE